ncbi:MAG: hypothetical protein ABSA74_00235 [Candidatus Staskawiczbacteria bacterium]|jgi:hypothetical protein
MEKEKNNRGIWIVVGIVVVILVIVAFSAGQNSNNQIQPTNVPATSNTEKQTTPVATTNQNTDQPTNKIVNNADEQTCTQQAAIFWQKQGGLCINCSYVSHYNSSLGKCFVLSTGGVVSTKTSFNLVLWDIYSGVKTAQYISIGGYNYQGCVINNAHVDGCTYYQFAPYLNSEMETTAY